MKNTELPRAQHAVQLVGPGELRHNPRKDIVPPGPHQILARVEAVGLCFSDLKLLKQFSKHVRKGEVVQGLPPEVLRQIPSYVPGDMPTVPGHEVVCRIVAVGDDVRHHVPGQRCLVQTDYRELRTLESNAAFGYNFEGGLQEYVLMDERVVVDPGSGESFLIPVDDALSASAVALVEPWACVEDSYVNQERRHVKAGGRLAVAAAEEHAIKGLAELLAQNPPKALTAVCATASQYEVLRGLGLPIERASSVEALAREHFDDIVYFGTDAPTIGLLNDRIAGGGIINIVTAGRRIGRPVSVGVGRVHYGMTRWIGTESDDARESYRTIPRNGEIRPGETVAIIGAAGPMGQMHVIRDLSLGLEGVSMMATDIDDARLDMLRKKAAALAEANRVELRMINTARQALVGRYTYFALLVPAGKLVADAIEAGAPGCLINIFAGIPAVSRQDLDLDTYIKNRCYMLGTSGSVIEDMKIVLGKVRSGKLDTNCSVDAVAGMAGAVAGIAAVENRVLAGKIIVYPILRELGLVPLTELRQRFPTVDARLERGQWTKAAEEELLRVACA
jgi:threonine dehydrogenase-like Zn-dependent dehydrogenase